MTRKPAPPVRALRPNSMRSSARAGEVTVVSAERIGGELRRMLLDQARSRAMELLRTLNLLGVVLPETAAIGCGGDGGAAWQETLRVLATLDEPSFPVALAALLHRGAGADVAQTVGERLRLSTKETERTGWLLSHLGTIDEAINGPWSRLQPVLVSEGADELLALYEAITPAGCEQLAHCRRKLDLPRDELDPAPLGKGGYDLGAVFDCQWVLQLCCDHSAGQVRCRALAGLLPSDDRVQDDVGTIYFLRGQHVSGTNGGGRAISAARATLDEPQSGSRNRGRGDRRCAEDRVTTDTTGGTTGLIDVINRQCRFWELKALPVGWSLDKLEVWEFVFLPNFSRGKRADV